MSALGLRRIVKTAIVATVATGALAGVAAAAWSAQGNGNASGLATTMPQGNAPTTRVSGSSVTVSWNAATFVNTMAVAGYTVQRYDAATGAQATVGAGCSGTVTATICTEQGVPAGNWTYTDTPVQDSWTGAPSPASSPVSVGAAPTAAAPAKPPTSPAAAPKDQPEGAAVSLSAASVDLGSQQVGTSNGARTATLTNNGTAPLVVSGVSIAGANAADFSKRTDGCSGKTLNPGRSCTVYIKFTPSATGPRSARLSFADNATASPETVALSGTGIHVADLGISLSATPNPVGVSGQLTTTVEVSNRGPDTADDVKVTDVIPSGSQFASIAPNGWTCTTPPVSNTGTVTCTRSSIPSGGSSSLTLTVTAVESGQTTVTNTAQLTSQSTDPTTSDNTATVTSSIQSAQ